MESSTSMYSTRTCYCGAQAHVRTSRTGNNPGRRFYGCRYWKCGSDGWCEYFEWLDNLIPKGAKNIIEQLIVQKCELEIEVEKLKMSGLKLKIVLVASWCVCLGLWFMYCSKCFRLFV
ncbi:hypothetical protein ACS0TY_035142 [Phlomoides rotata]